MGGPRLGAGYQLASDQPCRWVQVMKFSKEVLDVCDKKLEISLIVLSAQTPLMPLKRSLTNRVS